MLLFACPAAPAAERQTLDEGWHCLGDPVHPEYAWFHARHIEGPEWTLTFEAEPNPGEASLLLRQTHVKESWNVMLNDTRLGRLTANETPLQLVLTVPPGTLRAGENTLRITADRPGDTILVGDVMLDPRPVSESTRGARLEITVEDAGLATPLPSRLTVTDASGCLTPLRADPEQHLAVRPGVAYTGNGTARLSLQPGHYTVHATRGFEYGLATASLSLEPGDQQNIRLTLHREVDTAGWVSCDTHVHTLTHSGHGDATVEERVLTLAGEGIELPIATDHNTLANLEPIARTLQVRSWFTPVIGDEVTTRQSHFNVFPIVEGSRIPDFRIGAWPALLHNIRATPGVQVVILNHPHNIHNGFRPFDRQYFNPVTGQPRAVLDFGVDAMEILSSSAQQSDPMIVFRDWFAMLNGGHRVVGLGSSDVHDVNRYIVGQGRTYIRMDDSDPGRIDVDAACRSLKAGHALISMGLWVDLTVDEKHGAGEVATVNGPRVQVVATVKGPSWVHADEVVLYANGLPMARRRLAVADSERRPGGVLAEVTWNLPRPNHDIHLVAIASGPGVQAPFWPIPLPYQARSPFWTSRVIGANNPVWLDADGDGRFTCARELAAGVVKVSELSFPNLLLRLKDYDESVSAQAAALLEDAGMTLDNQEATLALARAPDPVRNGFSTYLAEGRDARPNAGDISP